MYIKILLRCSIPYASTGVVFNSILKAFQNRGIDITTQSTEDRKERIELWIGPCGTWCHDLPRTSKSVIGWDFTESPRFSDKGFHKTNAGIIGVDLIICTGNTSARKYRTSVYDIPILISPFGVDTTLFKYIERDFNIDPFTFLHFATGTRKGTNFVIEAFKQVVTIRPNSSLHIRYYKTPHLPNGTTAQNTISGVLALNTPNLTCSYYPHNNSDRNEAFGLYKDYHCLLAPSYEEGWGTCITEAMATGLPVITTKNSIMREYFSSKFGWWVDITDQYLPAYELFKCSGQIPIPDTNSLVNNMLSAIDNRELCSKKGRAGSNYVNNYLTWEHSIDRILPLLQTITDKGISEVVNIINANPVKYNYPYISF